MYILYANIAGWSKIDWSWDKKDIVDKMKKRVIQIDKGNIIRDDKKGGYDSEI